MKLLKHSSRALNFIPCKSHFGYSKALLHVHIYEILSGHKLDSPHIHVTLISVHENNLYVSVLFVYGVYQICQSNQIPPVECDNLIGLII